MNNGGEKVYSRFKRIWDEKEGEYPGQDVVRVESGCHAVLLQGHPFRTKSHIISLNVRATYLHVSLFNANVRMALKSRCFSLLLLISIEQRSIDHVVEIINTSPTTDCS